MASCASHKRIYGCTSDCPALWDGECTEIKKVLEDIKYDFSFDELAEVKSIYNIGTDDCENIW